MLMVVCIIISNIKTVTPTVTDKSYYFNVGTVLFTTADNERQMWTNSELALLKARKYFQEILPPPYFISNLNENYISSLLQYCKNAFVNIKTEASDSETDTILTTALSDALGGYFKVWILPAAKLDYYGGTVSQDQIIKLFQFYNAIKQYLNTDGTGWGSADENVLNSITINIARGNTPANTRSMKNPCDHLAYFEKTEDGFAVPLPNVNWNDQSSTMFVPLKNTSLVQMTKPDDTSLLSKYYHAAKSCIAENSPSDAEKFEQKFQYWLTEDVVPHLKDDILYLALGRVLTLTNRAQSICEKAINYYNQNVSSEPQNVGWSKRMGVIGIILLFEIAWCIPALLYIMCSKKKKDRGSNVYLYMRPSLSKGSKSKSKSSLKNVTIDQKGPTIHGPPTKVRSCMVQYPKEFKNTETQLSPLPVSHTCTTTSEENINKLQSCVTFQTQFPSAPHLSTVGTGSFTHVDGKNKSIETVQLPEPTPKKSALKKIPQSSPRQTFDNLTRDVLNRSDISLDSYNRPVEDSRKSQSKKSIKDSRPESYNRSDYSRNDPRNVAKCDPGRRTPKEYSRSSKSEESKNDNENKYQHRKSNEERKDPRNILQHRSDDKNKSMKYEKRSHRVDRDDNSRKQGSSKSIPPESNTTQHIKICQQPILRPATDTSLPIETVRPEIQKPPEVKKILHHSPQKQKIQCKYPTHIPRKQNDLREDPKIKQNLKNVAEETAEEKLIRMEPAMPESSESEVTKTSDSLVSYKSTPQKQVSEVKNYHYSQKRPEHPKPRSVKICEPVHPLKSCKFEASLPTSSESEVKSLDSHLQSLNYEIVSGPSTHNQQCACSDCICARTPTQALAKSSSSNDAGNTDTESRYNKQIVVTRVEDKGQIDVKRSFIISRDGDAASTSKKSAFRVSKYGQPFFEIIIDRPAKDIVVDVSGPSQKISSTNEQKRSKIPKLNTQKLTMGTAQKQLAARTIEERKSLIPQLRRRTVDDIVLARSPVSSDDKLNDTL